VILADENVPAAVVARLRADGRDVEWVAEALPAASDADVLAWAWRTGRRLLTDDKDFGELVVRQGPTLTVCCGHDGRRQRYILATARLTRVGPCA
jgi:predicted nuclease of predicted toxin-antitoxin system